MPVVRRCQWCAHVVHGTQVKVAPWAFGHQPLLLALLQLAQTAAADAASSSAASAAAVAVHLAAARRAAPTAVAGVQCLRSSRAYSTKLEHHQHELDRINELFVEARDEIEYAMEVRPSCIGIALLSEGLGLHHTLGCASSLTRTVGRCVLPAGCRNCVLQRECCGW